MSTTETPVLFEDSSKGRVEDPACPDAGRERSERSTQHADLEDFQARLARLNALKQTQSQPQPEQAPRPRSSKPSLGRHTRKCAVCNHPDREQIEDDFLRWHDPWDIADAYDLPSRSSLYRHAEAHGLIALRRRNLRGVAERLLERVDETTLTGNSILQAMRLFAHITEDGQWLEPPKRAIVTHIHTYSDSAPDPTPAPPAGSPTPNCHSERGCDEHPTRNLHLDQPTSATRQADVAVSDEPAPHSSSMPNSASRSTHPSSGSALSSMCHSEPVRVVRERCEESAVTHSPVVSTDPSGNARSDEPVGAALRRPPSSHSAPADPTSKARGNEPVGAGLSRPPLSCHSEQGCQHPTENLQFDGAIPVADEASVGQSRPGTDETESLPIARLTSAKSSTPDSCRAPSATRHSSFDTHRRVARARDRVKRAALLRDALELLPAATRILAAAEARASVESVGDTLLGSDRSAPGDAIPSGGVTRHLSLDTRPCLSNRDTKLQSRSCK